MLVKIKKNARNVKLYLMYLVLQHIDLTKVKSTVVQCAVPVYQTSMPKN